MTVGLVEPPKRIGIVGRFDDPVAQLLQDLPEMQDTQFVEVMNPQADCIGLERLIVLSLDDAFAHFAALQKCGCPCTVVLHRAEDVRDRSGWESGLRQLGIALDRVDWPALSLVALTNAAADEISACLDRPVRPLPPLARITRSRPRVTMRPGEIETTFSMPTPSGQRETRRAEPGIYNWARLRRLAWLRVPDENAAALADLVEWSNGQEDQAPAPSQRPVCVLAVVPNGVGLGHVTRMMAIGRALKKHGNARVIFWSFSRAAEIMQAAGFEVILRQNAVHLNAHPPSWRRWETLEFAHAIRTFKADLVANDGANFDPFIFDALRMPGCGQCGVLWVRRGMLRPDTDAKLLELEQNCDLVLEPGDLAVEYDRGPTRTRRARLQGFSSSLTSRPVTLKPFLRPHTPKEARRLLGLGRGRHVLVSLGGAFGSWDALKQRLEDMARQKRVTLVWAQSLLAPPPGHTEDGTLVRRFYPLNRYLGAFDGVVTATGYNSFHELMMAYDGPVLFAPTNYVRLDDQVARATWAQDQGWADVVLADKPHEHQDRIASFMDRVVRGEKTERPTQEFAGHEVADAIIQAAAPYRKAGGEA